MPLLRAHRLKALSLTAVLLCAAAGMAIGQEKPVGAPKKPDIYDEHADAKAQIAAALEKARRENQRVLVQWGANWCGWCRLLHGEFEKDPALHKELSYEYQWVLIDVGQFDKNLDLVQKYGAAIKKKGIPYLTILDADGKVIANQESGVFETHKNDKAGHDPVALTAFLKSHEAPHAKADAVLAAAQKKARADGKRVFLVFGAPW